MDVGHVTGIDRIKPEGDAPGYIVFTDTNGVVSLFGEDEILSAIGEHRPNVVLEKIEEEHYPCNELDYMTELKIHRDAKGFLGMSAVAPDDGKLLQVDAVQRWLAHPNHGIVKSICIQSPTTVLTSSDDGFMCVWDLKGGLLGEMRLPNVSEGKKFRRKKVHLPVNEIDWNFPQERHDVSEKHVKKASELLMVKKRRTTRRVTNHNFNRNPAVKEREGGEEEKKQVRGGEGQGCRGARVRGIEFVG